MKTKNICFRLKLYARIEGVDEIIYWSNPFFDLYKFLEIISDIEEISVDFFETHNVIEAFVWIDYLEMNLREANGSFMNFSIKEIDSDVIGYIESSKPNRVCFYKDDFDTLIDNIINNTMNIALDE